MVFLLIGTADEELQYRKPDDLRSEIDFVSMTEMRRFLDGDRFRSYFETYARVWIIPQQRAALAAGNSRGRGPQFITVQERMIVGERSESDKYFNPFPDKTNWDQIDHCAFMLYWICQVNTKSSSDIFFNKGLLSRQIHLRAWMLIKQVEYNKTSSRNLADKTTLLSQAPSSLDDTLSQPSLTQALSSLDDTLSQSSLAQASSSSGDTLSQSSLAQSSSLT